MAFVSLKETMEKEIFPKMEINGETQTLTIGDKVYSVSIPSSNAVMPAISLSATGELTINCGEYLEEILNEINGKVFNVHMHAVVGRGMMTTDYYSIGGTGLYSYEDGVLRFNMAMDRWLIQFVR